MCHSWIRNWGGLQSSLCKDGARPGPRSMTQRPSGRPPNERQPTDSHFCPSTGRFGNLWPTGLTAQKPTLNSGTLPISHCLNTLLISAALCFWHPSAARLFLGGVLLGELGLADVVAAQLDVEHALEVTQDLLVRGGGAALEVGDDGGRRVALRGELLLRHGRGLGVARGLDGLGHLGPHRLGLDDVVAAVHLCQALALAACLALLVGR
ncbi:hypothetical protein FJTKL_10720 [Diaporthe vaccinii]|uniref:Uncharacterized protein n=1 Tax=Diaporthe vaccinii TaxID=105482 RepID=A0ABR4FBH6_9PEZI